MGQVIIYFLSSIMLIFAVERFMRVFFEKTRTQFMLILGSYLFYMIIPNLAFFIFNNPIINMLTSILSIFLITLTYESTMVKRVIATISIYVFLGIIDVAVGLIYLQNDVPFLAGTEFSYYIHLVLGFLTYLLSLLLQNFKSIRKNHVNKSVHWISSILIPMLSLFVILALSFSINIQQYILIFIITMLFGINLCSVYFYELISKSFEDKYQAILEAQGKEYYISQCEIMQESAEKLKSFRHDTKLHLATLRDFAINKNADDISGYISLLIGDIEKSDIYSDTGNLTFDSIINYKLRNASSDDIKLDLKVFIPPVLNFETADIITILGNILDNALDAIEKVEEKWLKLNIYLEKGTLLIKVENPFDGVIKFKNEKKDEIMSTKQGNDHGYGIKNIRKSIDKYNGNFDIATENNVFSVSILLFHTG